MIDTDEDKIAAANLLVRPILAAGAMVLPAQVQAELHHLLRRKAGFSSQLAAEMVDEYADLATTIPTDTVVLIEAFDLAEKHNLQTYDAIILAAAAQAGCDVLYSEDMQHGFEWNGVLIVNPFA